jgi:hypothetical protein
VSREERASEEEGEESMLALVKLVSLTLKLQLMRERLIASFSVAKELEFAYNTWARVYHPTTFPAQWQVEHDSCKE